MFRLNKTLPTLLLFWLLACASLLAGPKDSLQSEYFQKYVEQQNVELQNTLRAVFPEEKGFIVIGPINPNYLSDSDIGIHYSSPRVLCPDLDALRMSSELIKRHGGLSIVSSQLNIESSVDKLVRGFRGAILTVSYNGQADTVQILTLQQLRLLLWTQQVFRVEGFSDRGGQLRKYALSISDYFYEIDKGNLDAPEPKAVDFGLEEKYDLYAPPPDYVIQGYQNYKDYLKSHAEIVTSKLSEILAFVPTESGLDRLKSEAPDIAYPNKEYRLLQEEFRKFIRRGGQMSYMRTLTKEVFDTLKSAEYFFAVGMSGKIRFGRELLREEVKRIEAETGQKPARANHAFLFVGEPVLTAGAFFIENDGEPRIVEVNTQSGHYFYSNITATIREDVAERSNDYFKTIGHFFRALDSLEIDYHDALLRKL